MAEKYPWREEPEICYFMRSCSCDEELALKLQREEEELAWNFHREEELALKLQREEELLNRDRSCAEKLQEKLYTRDSSDDDDDDDLTSLLSRNAMAQNHPSGARPKRYIQRPLRRFRMQTDEEIARTLQQEEDIRMSDEQLAQCLQENLNISNDAEQAAELQQEFTRYRGMTDVDALLAKQLQKEEELKQNNNRQQHQRLMAPQLANSQRAGMPLLGMHPFLFENLGRERPRRVPHVLQRLITEVQELPAGENHPVQLLMANEPENFFAFMNLMRDAPMLAAVLTNNHGNTVLQDVDLNDYDALWDLAESLGEVKNNGMTEEELSELPTHRHRDNSAKNSECQICLSKFERGDELRTLPCTHEYHTSCIDEWLKRNATCPVCRNNIKSG